MVLGVVLIFDIIVFGFVLGVMVKCSKVSLIFFFVYINVMDWVVVLCIDNFFL